ncbi:MAG TPA: trypsin-like peptidase domain-containing protein [Kofleriaceae bacterium]
MMRGSRLLPVLLAGAAVACSGAAKNTPGGGAKMTAKDIVQQSTPAIVRVEVGDGLGTGFIVDKSGLVATNFHVVRGRKDITIKLHDGGEYPVLAIAGIDPGRDLALLRIQPTKPLPVVRLGDSDAMSAGDQIVAIGNPLGVFDYSVSSGLVSQVRPVCTKQQVEQHNRGRARFEELVAKKNRSATEEQELEDLRCSQELTILQISAPISQGSSGGPLFNQAGEVIGVTTAIISGGQNINLAIPTNYLKAIITRPASISMAEFAQKTGEATAAGPDDDVPIKRAVPTHQLTVFDGCKHENIADVVKAIWEAIELGAPLYNQGNHEACFRIYENAVTKYERDAACKGVRTAFGDGLLRAQGMKTFKEKAWALRDSFDGLLEAAERWTKQHGPITPPKAPDKSKK